MRFSVIVNTLNRAECLRVLLAALEYQTDPDFEVVVVNGPSTDDTDAVLAEYAGRIRAFDCPVANLSMSRNVGIAAAAGDICTFIDDDGVPEPQWLADMRAGFTGPDVAGVGGIIYDHTGHALEYANVVCDRFGNAAINVPPPLTPYQLQGADPYLHLMGGNTSYRRAVLAAVGGFDEEIEYYLDEAELCLRLNDRGFWLTMSPRAAMLHKSAPSHVRCAKQVVRRPYPVVKNKLYYCLQSARAGGQNLAAALDDGMKFADLWAERGKHRRDDGTFTPDEYEQYAADIKQAVRDGTARGVSHARKGRAIPPADPAKFLRFPTLTPADDRLTVCLVSADYPTGGAGRYFHTLAGGLAGDGHEVHVIARSPDHDRVDFEAGVWVHRVVPHASGWAAAAHAEVKRVAATRSIDLVHTADGDGVYCQLDDDLRTVLTLTPANLSAMSDLDRATVRTARYALAPSPKVAATFGIQADVVPFGVDDVADEFARTRKPDGKVRVLTVGRLDPRNGTDVLLDVAAELCPEWPQVEFVLAGADETYAADYARKHGSAAWANRVVFRETASAQEYADCDIVCLPFRFASAGLEAVEAMSFGKPVVGCGVGGLAEVIEDGVTGLVAYPGSAGSLARCVRELIADAGKRDRFGRAARERYEAEFSTAVMTRNTVAAYTRAVAAAA